MFLTIATRYDPVCTPDTVYIVAHDICLSADMHILLIWLD